MLTTYEDFSNTMTFKAILLTCATTRSWYCTNIIKTNVTMVTISTDSFKHNLERQMEQYGKKYGLSIKKQYYGGVLGTNKQKSEEEMFNLQGIKVLTLKGCEPCIVVCPFIHLLPWFKDLVHIATCGRTPPVIW